jgi:hypothetical protein
VRQRGDVLAQEEANVARVGNYRLIYLRVNQHFRPIGFVVELASVGKPGREAPFVAEGGDPAATEPVQGLARGIERFDSSVLARRGEYNGIHELVAFYQELHSRRNDEE